MYEHAGYRRVPRYNDNPWATHFFEKRLVAGPDERPDDPA